MAGLVPIGAKLRSSLPGLTRQSIDLRKNFLAKKMDARVKPAHDEFAKQLKLAPMGSSPRMTPLELNSRTWGWRYPANSTAFSCKYNARNPASMPATLFACKLPSLVVEQTRNKTSPAQGMMPSRPALQVRHYPFLPSRVSHKVSYNHIATFSANFRKRSRRGKS